MFKFVVLPYPRVQVTHDFSPKKTGLDLIRIEYAPVSLMLLQFQQLLGDTSKTIEFVILFLYFNMSNLKLGIIGAGKMAGALVRGWVSSGLVSGSQVSRDVCFMT